MLRILTGDGFPRRFAPRNDESDSLCFDHSSVIVRAVGCGVLCFACAVIRSPPHQSALRLITTRFARMHKFAQPNHRFGRSLKLLLKEKPKSSSPSLPPLGEGGAQRRMRGLSLRAGAHTGAAIRSLSSQTLVRCKYYRTKVLNRQGVGSELYPQSSAFLGGYFYELCLAKVQNFWYDKENTSPPPWGWRRGNPNGPRSG